MTYTEIALAAVIAVALIDLVVLKTALLRRRSFWTAYSIMLFFQLLTNWWLTSRKILSYSENAIIGWRIAAAPVEDLFFGFALIVSTLSLWIFWGRRGLERN